MRAKIARIAALLCMLLLAESSAGAHSGDLAAASECGGPAPLVLSCTTEPHVLHQPGGFLRVKLGPSPAFTGTIEQTIEQGGGTAQIFRCSFVNGVPTPPSSCNSIQTPIAANLVIGMPFTHNCRVFLAPPTVSIDDAQVTVTVPAGVGDWTCEISHH